MYTYRITTSGVESFYRLSIPHLQGIYTYLSIMQKQYPGITMVRIPMGSDPKITPSFGSGMFGISGSYETALERPLEYTGISGIGRSVYYPPRSIRIPNGLSIRAMITRSDISYTSIITKDLSSFLSGFLFMQMICEQSHDLTLFAIVSSRESGYIPLSPLTGFPLLQLPSELINIITDYYPCDWPRVSRRLYAINGSKALFDIRRPVSSLRYIVKTLNTSQVSDSQVDLFARLIRTVNLSSDTLHKLLDELNHQVIYPKIVDAIVERYSVLPDGSINRVQGLHDLILGNMSRMRISKPLIKYLIRNKKYSDILYFPSPNGINDELSRLYWDVHTILFEEGFTTDTHNMNIFAEGADEGTLASLTEFVLNKKGVFEKGSTNPITGTTHPGSESRSEINIANYVFPILDRIRYLGLPSVLVVILRRIDEIPDGPYLELLLPVENERGYGMSYALRTFNPVDFPSPEDERILKKVYHKILTSPLVSIDAKNNFLGDLDNIAQRESYSPDLVNYIRSISPT